MVRSVINRLYQDELKEALSAKQEKNVTLAEEIEMEKMEPSIKVITLILSKEKNFEIFKNLERKNRRKSLIF